MRIVKIIIPALLIVIIFSSCRKSPYGIWGRGNNVTEERNTPSFTGIHLAMDADVYYVQDSIYSVVISAQPNILPYIETEVQGRTLKIDCRPNLHAHHTIVVTVHSPDMNSLHLSGSGNIYAQNNILANSMELFVSGSGDISIPFLEARDLTGKISGSGSIDVLGGNADYVDFRISGSGDIDALNMVADTVEATISGSGNMTLHVLKYLNVSISGSGSVKYKGNPIVETRNSGSGRVIHIN